MESVAAILLLLVLGAATAASLWNRMRGARRGCEKVDRQTSELWSTNELEGRLAKLDEMYASGWLSLEEYERQRAAITSMM